MVRAILEGKKTQTRRSIKVELGLADFHEDNIYVPDEYGDYHKIIEYSKIHKGDILYVRETFADTWTPNGLEGYVYKADGEPDYFPYWGNASLGKDEVWRPSIHMPKKAARIFLKVTDVRVERVQDISFTGAIAEGIECTELYHDLLDECSSAGLGTGDLPVEAFAELWDNLYGNWNDNPWVWVIEFERIEKPKN